MTITFQVFGLPQTKGSSRGFPVKRKNGRIGVVITNDNDKNKPWAATVSGEAQRHRPSTPFTGPVRLMLAFGVQKPKSYPKTKELPATKKPDLDKMIRSVKDALRGVLYRDDSQVVELRATKAYSDTPGVLIELEGAL